MASKVMHDPGPACISRGLPHTPFLSVLLSYLSHTKFSVLGIFEAHSGSRSFFVFNDPSS